MEATRAKYVEAYERLTGRTWVLKRARLRVVPHDPGLARDRRRRLHRRAHRAHTRRPRSSPPSSSTTSPPASARTSPTTCRSCRHRYGDANGVRAALQRARCHRCPASRGQEGGRRVGRAAAALLGTRTSAACARCCSPASMKASTGWLFSSSAAVFGEPPVELRDRGDARLPDQPVRRDEAGRRVDAA